jgi:hypothetical protein
MSAKTTIVLVALAAALGQQGQTTPANAVPMPAPAAKVARDFLYAFSRNNRDAVESLLPKRLENLYGPAPYAAMPRFTKNRVDSRVAAIDFEGRMADSSLPRKGTIILRLVEERGVRAWRIRQIYWYDDLPPQADLPDSSPTAADRAQEPRVRRAATQFIEAWLAGNYQRMDELTFHWWRIERDPPKWVELTGADLTARSTTLDGLRVDFVAELRVLRLLPKRVRGNLWMVEEDGAWRVRPLTFSFFF